MGRVENVPDSYAPLLFEMQFVQASRPVRILFTPIMAGGQDIAIKTTDYLRSIRLETSIESAWSGTVVLFDTDEDYIESLITALQHEDRIIKFRWGFDAGRGLGAVSWRRGRITEWEPTYTHEGVELTISVLASPSVDAANDKRNRSFAEGLTPSAIVREIAADRGWETTDIDGNPTIQDTTYLLDKPLQQQNEDDMRFIRRTLLQHASDADGQAFQFYIDEQDAVHFHTRSYFLNFHPVPVLAASYVFARDVQGEVLGFTPNVGTMFSAFAGAENAVYIFTDEKTGRRITIETTAEGGPDNAIIGFPDEKVQQGNGAGVKARIVIPARSLEEGRQMVRVRYDRLRQTNYSATLEVRGTHAVKASDHISIRYYKKNGAEHHLSGVYWVESVQHDVSAGDWKTVFALQRAGSRAQEQTPVEEEIQADKQQVIEEVNEVTYGEPFPTPQVKKKASGEAKVSKRVRAQASLFEQRKRELRGS